ncbi:MAG: hypothetical protein WA261_19295 [Candidatus Sulfotelmatobacter sp.]
MGARVIRRKVSSVHEFFRGSTAHKRGEKSWRPTAPPSRKNGEKAGTGEAAGSAAMEECLVTSAEAAAIILEGRRRHGRIAETWVAFDIWPLSLIDITACGGEAIVKTLPGNFSKFRRRRWLFIDWMWMRASG